MSSKLKKVAELLGLNLLQEDIRNQILKNLEFLAKHYPVPSIVYEKKMKSILTNLGVDKLEPKTQAELIEKLEIIIQAESKNLVETIDKSQFKWTDSQNLVRESSPYGSTEMWTAWTGKSARRIYVDGSNVVQYATFGDVEVGQKLTEVEIGDFQRRGITVIHSK